MRAHCTDGTSEATELPGLPAGLTQRSRLRNNLPAFPVSWEAGQSKRRPVSWAFLEQSACSLPGTPLQVYSHQGV